MRRVAACGFVVALAAMSACDSNDTTTPVDPVTINGQVLQGTVPAFQAFVYGVDRNAIAAALGDASLFPAPAPNLTDGTGHFAIGGYSSSYDLTIFPANAPHDATIVQNLGRRDPVVTLPVPQNMPFYSCHVATSWTTPLPAGATVAYLLNGPTYPGVELVGVAPVDSNPLDGLTATWRGSFSTNVTLLALAFSSDPKTNLPSTYLGVASTYLFLIDQREVTFPISLQATDTSSLSVNFTPPSGYSVENVDVALDLGVGSTSFDLAHFDSPTGTLSVNVPDIFENRLVVRGTATNAGSSSAAVATAVAYPSTTSTAALTFPDPTSLTSPNDGATGVDGTTVFAWNGAGVNEIIFSSSDPNAPNVRIVTAAQSMTLGQFIALSNAAIPAGAHYSWMARRWQDYPTTDSFEGAEVDLTTAANASSATRSFTFASQ